MLWSVYNEYKIQKIENDKKYKYLVSVFQTEPSYLSKPDIVEDVECQIFFTQRGVLPEGFTYVKPDEQSELESLRKYDREPVFSMPNDEPFRKAKAHIDILVGMIGETLPLPDELVKFKPLSTPGKHFKQAGFKHKRDVILDDRVLEDWYLCENFIPLWGVSVKSELLPNEKALARGINLRTFMGADVLHTYIGAKLYENMNKIISLNRLFCTEVGVSKQHGGWNDLANRMTSDLYEIGDVRRYDGSFPIWGFELVRGWRKMMLPKRFHAYHEWFYNNVCPAYLRVSNGRVYRKWTGNPSGSYNTTIDNCLMHLFVNLYSYYKRHPEGTFSGFYSDYKLFMYGDDYVLCKRLGHSWSKEDRIEDYKTCGFELKSDVREETDLSKVNFLGAFFQRFKGMWVPKPDGMKIVCSLVSRPKKESLDERAQRAISLYVEGYFTDFRSQLKQWALQIYVPSVNSIEVSGDRYSLSSFPSEKWIEDLYLGTESS